MPAVVILSKENISFIPQISHQQNDLVLFTQKVRGSKSCPPGLGRERLHRGKKQKYAQQSVGADLAFG
jgi:hypothetical protein